MVDVALHGRSPTCCKAQGPGVFCLPQDIMQSCKLNDKGQDFIGENRVHMLPHLALCLN